MTGICCFLHQILNFGDRLYILMKNIWNVIPMPQHMYQAQVILLHLHGKQKEKKIPICVSGEKKVSAPAFVFGSGVPANALEMEGTGAGQTGSMMPRFTYREEESGIWSDNPMYNSQNINNIVKKHDNAYIDLKKKLNL